MAAETCEACGAKTARDAAFCHRCGARFDVPVVDVDLFSPTAVQAEPDAAPSPGSRRTGLIVAVAAVIAIIAVSAFWNSGDDPPESADDPNDNPADGAVPNSSPGGGTDPSDDVEVNPEAARALTWTSGPDLGEVWPLGFVEHDDAVFLFTGGAISPFGEVGAGMQAWRSDDGEAWESLGSVVPAPAVVKSVVAAPNGFVAVGTDTDDEPTAWQSGDGVEWVAERLPTIDRPEAPSSVPYRISATADTVVVVGRSPFGSVPRVAARAIADHLGDDLGDYVVGWGLSPPALFVTGPLGLRILELPLDDIGSTDEERASVQQWAEGRNLGPAATVVWSRTGDGPWETTTIEDFWEYGLTRSADGTFFLLGRGSGGESMTRRSTDGIVWTEGSESRATDVQPWGDGLVGLLGNAVGLRVSTADDTWETIPLADLLPEATNRYLTSLATGRGGIAIQADYMDDETPTPSASLLEDGFTLTIPGGRSGEMIVEDDTGERLRIVSYEPPDGRYEADLDSQTITFLDVDTGEALVTFPIDDLRRLEARTLAEISPSSQLIALSTDTRAWSINWLSDLTDAQASIVRIGIGQGHAIAAIATSPRWMIETPTIQLFTAELPAG